MKLAGLSTDQAPPFSVPMRFFLTAPLFGMLAMGLLFLPAKEGLFLTRWLPAVLASTHALVLGVIASIMFGAIQQMLPVIAGAPIHRPKLLSTLIHILWTSGVICLVIGFITSTPLWHMIALPLLGLGASLFIWIVLEALRRASASNGTVTAMQAAVTALLITVLLGLYLGAGHSGLVPLQRPLLTNIHFAWGLVGWIGFLIIGIAYQVIPMFQITPSYPHWMRKLLVPALLGLLTARSALTWFGDAPSEFIKMIGLVLELGISAGLVLFSITTFYLQSKRKRKIWDTTLWFWRIGMVALFLCVSFGFMNSLHYQWPLHPILGSFQLPSVSLGALYLFGFVLPVILGMLYKIVPFLVWFHLQGLQTSRMMAGQSMLPVPNMKEVISDRSTQTQLGIYCTGLLLLAIANLFPHYLTFAVGLFFASFVLLAFQLASAYHLFLQTKTTLLSD